MKRIRFFRGRYGIDYYVTPAIAIDFGRMGDSHNIFMVALRWWIWEIGFTVLYNHNLMQNEGSKLF